MSLGPSVRLYVPPSVHNHFFSGKKLRRRTTFAVYLALFKSRLLKYVVYLSQNPVDTYTMKSICTFFSFSASSIYYGQGNDCRRLLKNVDRLESMLPPKHHSYLAAFRSFDALAKACLSYDLDPDYKQKIQDFRTRADSFQNSLVFNTRKSFKISLRRKSISK